VRRAMLRIHSSPARALASSQRPTWPSTARASSQARAERRCQRPEFAPRREPEDHAARRRGVVARGGDRLL
jgi:hypothetical protein